MPFSFRRQPAPDLDLTDASAEGKCHHDSSSRSRVSLRCSIQPLQVRRARTGKTLAMLAMLAAALAAACGGGSSGGSGTKDRPTPDNTCAIKRADIDNDGAVSIFDLTKVSGQFGQRVPPAPRELDLDGDGAVTVLDLNLITGVFIKQVSECP